MLLITKNSIMVQNSVLLISCVLSFSCLVSAERAGNIIGEKDADSGARLQAVMNLMVKTANTSTEGQVVPANQAEAHKQMNAVLGQWADFIEATKNNSSGPEILVAKPGRRSALAQTRWYNNNNNNYNNNDQGASPAEEAHENHYYANQGYYSRLGSPGTEVKKAPHKTTTVEPASTAAPSVLHVDIEPPRESTEHQEKDDKPIF